jgi:hypothetical protein
MPQENRYWKANLKAHAWNGSIIMLKKMRNVTGIASILR